MRPVGRQEEAGEEGEERGQGGEEGRRIEVDGAPAHLVWLLYKFSETTSQGPEGAAGLRSERRAPFLSLLNHHYC